MVRNKGEYPAKVKVSAILNNVQSGPPLPSFPSFLKFIQQIQRIFIPITEVSLAFK